MARVPTVAWRGVTVSRDMVDPLDELAASVRPWVAPIPGYGSYRKNAASGGTDNGSGHLDIYARTGWSQADRDLFVANARRMGFMAFYRPPTWWSPVRGRTISGGWAHHFHLILKDSEDLAWGAVQQLSQWFAGSNGLAPHNGKYDPDTGPRQFIRQTWAQYAAIKAIAGEIVDTATGPKTSPGKTSPAKDWFDMASEADLRRVVRDELARVPIAHPTIKGATWPLRDALWSGWTYAMDASARVAQLQHEVAQLRAVVEGRTPEPEPDPTPPTPPTPSPSTHALRGVDVSGHQTLAQVKTAMADPKYAFAIVKATEGEGWTSNVYAAQMGAVRDASKLAGAYHFAWPNQDPAKEAANFLVHAQLRPRELPCLDVENWGGKDAKTLMVATSWAQRLAFTLVWLGIVKRETGANPAVYANWDWIKNFRTAATVAQWDELTSYPLWLADYDSGTPGKHPTVDPKPGTSRGWPVLLHQWTSNDNRLDGNYLHGGEAAWLAAAIPGA